MHHIISKLCRGRTVTRNHSTWSNFRFQSSAENILWISWAACELSEREAAHSLSLSVLAKTLNCGLFVSCNFNYTLLRQYLLKCLCFHCRNWRFVWAIKTFLVLFDTNSICFHDGVNFLRICVLYLMSCKVECVRPREIVKKSIELELSVFSLPLVRTHVLVLNKYYDGMFLLSGH